MSEQFIGNYRVVSLIGRGGMGRVYLAVHKDVPNLRVILKILSDPRLADRFKQEADKLALLDGHPNICQIKHFFHHEEDLVIAMEYIDGCTLDDKLKNEGRTPVAEAARIMSDMLAILEYAHQRGISHRDIKPSNVMIDKSGQVKIIDFGIAKGKTDQSLTMTGASLGTPAYMAPEQFIPQDDTDYAFADIYACGTTLFYMLTGELPFKGDNEFLLRDAKLNSKPPSPRSLNAGISKELEKIILRAIEKEPSRRFASAEEMRKALQATLRDERAHADQPTQAVSTGQQPRSSTGRPKKKAPLPLIGLAVVLLLAAAGYYFFLRPEGGSETAELSVPILLEPAERATLPGTVPLVLRWQGVLPPGGVYKVEYTTDSTFAASKQIRTSADSLAFPAGMPAGPYRWRVTALSATGEEGPLSLERLVTIEEAGLPQGTLMLAAMPSGQIYLGNRLLADGGSSARIVVDTGRYIVRVENSHSREKVLHDTLRVDAGATVRKDYRFTVAETPPAPPVRPAVKRGEVRVGSTPRGAAIYVDGRLQEVQTNNTVWLEPGEHVIALGLTVDGRELLRSDTITVVADSVHKVIVNFEQ